MIRRKYLVLAILITILLLILILYPACESPSFDKFPAYPAYEELSDEDITYLRAEFGFPAAETLSPLDDEVEHTDDKLEAVADAIMQWQIDTMILVSPAEESDVSYPMRWNTIMPGIYPVSRMVHTRHRLVESTQKLYGVCWDFATVFKALSDYFGLEARITAKKDFLSDLGTFGHNQQPGADRGMADDEAQALQVWLSSLSLQISDDVLRSEMRETYSHYRGEVYIGSTWQAFDATQPTEESYINDDNFEESPWDEHLSTAVAYRR